MSQEFSSNLQSRVPHFQASLKEGSPPHLSALGYENCCQHSLWPAVSFSSSLSCQFSGKNSSPPLSIITSIISFQSTAWRRKSLSSGPETRSKEWRWMLVPGVQEPSSNLPPACPTLGEECAAGAFQLYALRLEHRGTSINSSPELGLGASGSLYITFVDCLWAVTTLSSHLPFFSLLPSFPLCFPSCHPVNTDWSLTLGQVLC